jgi:hypothetical protein
MSYPGDASLTPEIRQRITSTFEQTLVLAAQGNCQEALLGCDFILRLDPAFGPGRTLQERLRSAGEGPVEVADLEGWEEAAPPPPAAAPAADPAAPSPPAGAPPAAAPPVAPAKAPPAPAAGDAMEAALADLLAKRELKRLVQVAEEKRREVAANPKLRKIVETAYSRLEAEPYLKNFLDSARQALQSGDVAEAERLLAKARSLDPTHPGIAEIETAKGFYEAPERRMGTRRLGVAGGEAPTAEADAAAIVAEAAAAAVGGSEPAPPAALAVEDGDLAVAGGDGRIRELLAEGQASFERGDYQEAIDSWSRIFLIDIDHEVAARRIEEARKLKAEAERRLEEVFHGAVTALDEGDEQTARDGFERVLAIQPHHLTAREYLEQIDQGTAPAPSPPPEPAVEAATEPIAPRDEAGSDQLVLREEIIVPPPPGARPAPAGEAGPRAPKEGARRRFLAIGGAVLALVLVVGFFAYRQWDRLFPNSAVPAATEAQASDAIARATAMHDAGRAEAALRYLRRLKPDHPQYAAAQDLIAQWEAAQQAPPPATEEKAGPSPEDLARRDAVLDRAREAYAHKEYLLAAGYFRRAAEIAPLSGTAADLEQDTQRQLEPLKQSLDLFHQREWEFVLPTLWRMHQADSGNRDVVRLIVDSYYNLAVRDLQRGDPVSAAAKLGEALALDPGSPALKRHKLFADTYSQRPQDLLYRIYVKYLPFR